MVRFKVGDKVRRKFGTRGGGSVIGPILTVEKVGETTSGQGLRFAGDKGIALLLEADLFEIVESAVNTRPQAGEYWRQRDGKVVGPLRMHEHTGLLYLDTAVDINIGAYWYSTGVWGRDVKHDKDLVERVEVCAYCGQPIDKTV